MNPHFTEKKLRFKDKVSEGHGLSNLQQVVCFSRVVIVKPSVRGSRY